MAELAGLKKMGVFEVVELPKGRKAIGSRIVFKVNRDGVPVRRKARIVAKGFSQQYSVDYSDTFAAMAHPSAIRLVLALAAMNNWFVNSADVEQAFLHCDLHETIYMQPPAGLEEDGNKVWRLRKGLYGLSQASRLFFKHLAARLKEF
eukprot:3400989-Rhodomonas_salina.1